MSLKIKGANKGQLRNAAFKQNADMSGLRWGAITPTDIDLYLEFRGKLRVFVELKRCGSRPSYGQMRALEILCKNADLTPHQHTYVLIAEHETPQGDLIDAANCPVTSIYDGRSWKPVCEATTKMVIDSLLEKHGLGYLVHLNETLDCSGA